jgi:membrane protein implicated in regulation of membrane protease activity
MTWADFYLFCFAFGFLASVVTVVTGHLHIDFGTADADPGALDLSSDGGAAADGSGHHAVSPLNFGTVAAFLAWFGGTGYLITRFYRFWFLSTLGVAIAGGLAGGWIVYLFLAKVLMRSRAELDPADYDMIGVFGTVCGAIHPGRIGEILFTQQGSRRASPARSEDGISIPSGTEVVVTRYEGGIAYVRRWDDLAGDSTK